MGTQLAADVLVETLEQAGVKSVWGVPGDSLNAFTDALGKRNHIKWLEVRHEEAAAFAASAYADATNELGVCVGSCGPGNLHLINGLFEAQRMNAPVLVIAAQIPSSELGLGYFQETHPEILFKECSDYCELVSSAEQLPRVLETAMRSAITRRSVSVVVVPGDVAFSKAATQPVKWSTPILPVVTPPRKELEDLAELLNKTKNIAILCGYGCRNAHEQVVALAKKLKAPIVHALRGKSFIEYDNPYDVGMTGLIGFSSGYHALKECDFLLMLGTNFPYRNFYPEHGNVVQIDLRGEHLGRRTPLLRGLVGDIGSTLDLLLPLLSEQTDNNFLNKALAHYESARKGLDELAIPNKPERALHPQYLAARVSALADDDALFTADVGTPTVWAARYLKMNGKRYLTGSFIHGSMANATPQAMGLQEAFPNRQVIAFAGDGGLSMLLGELCSLALTKLPVKVIVFNNKSLGFVAMEMKAAGLMDDITRLNSPDFAAVAEGCGVKGFTVTSSEQLDDTLKAAFEYNGPVVIDVHTETQELSIPPKINLEQAKGFSLYMLKAILSGRGDEVKELVKANLFRS